MGRRLSYDQLVQHRTKGLLAILVIGYILLTLRLIYIQVIRAPYFKNKAEELTVSKIPLYARRGTIYDRNGKKLAVSISAYDISVRPAAIEHKREASALLSPILNLNRDDLSEKLLSRNRAFYLKRRVDLAVGDKVKALKIQGVDVLRTTKRVYPNGNLAAHILGFIDVDGIGIEGLEKKYNEILSGQDGYVIAELDAWRNIIPGTRKKRVEPVDGEDIILSIDADIQHDLETALKDSYESHSAAGASAIVMDPKTGEILALANFPTYDPANVAASDAASRRNRAITDLYEPGSTLKTITASAALDAKAIDTTDTFVCTGSRRVGRRTIRCSLHGREFAHGHGTCNVAKMLKYSCNISAAGMGFKLGKERLHEYEEAFGLYEKPGTGLVGEVGGWPDPWKNWADIHLANVAFGQGIAVTPMQMARAYSAVANGGQLMQPIIVREIRDNITGARKLYEPKVTRQAVSEEVAHMVSEMLAGVVDEGTGKNAKIEGYRVAGKTGSAEKASTTHRGYEGGKYIASFAGFLPISDPRIVIIVAVDEPKGTHWGATVAAPVFHAVAKNAMWRLKVPPDELPEETPPSNGEPAQDNNDAAEHQPSDRPHYGG